MMIERGDINGVNSEADSLPDVYLLNKIIISKMMLLRLSPDKQMQIATSHFRHTGSIASFGAY